MPISRLVLENFRNLQNLDLSFSQGFVVLHGSNGAGKTNFLEAIYFGSCLRKFPESQTSQLFRHGADFFRIRVESENGPDIETAEAVCKKEENKFLLQPKHNNQLVRRSKYAGFLPVVSFLPQDLNLLTRSPGGRREFLDETLSLISIQYRYVLREYGKALRQRNELLKSIKAGEASRQEMAVWDERLSEFGSLVTNERSSLFSYLNSKTTEALSSLSPELKTVEFIYEASGDAREEVFLKKLQSLQSDELTLATTMVGPHRDDFHAVLEGRAVVGYLSRGQLRSLTLCLKLIERMFVEEKLKTTPIILLDDVFSEFDTTHQQQLISYLKTFPQIFFTTAHLEEVKGFLPANSQIFQVNKGIINV